MSVNKVILVGRLGRDPEVRYTPDGKAIANISLATSESWRDKNTNERVERTEWHRVSMFGRLAEIAGEYLKSGSQIFVEGKIKTRKWQDKEGQDRYTTEIIADHMQMIGGRSDNNQGSSQRGYDDGGFEPQKRQAQPPYQPNMADMDDSIPF